MTCVVEIHVPLVPTPGLDSGADAFPWIDQVEDFLVDLEDEGAAEVHDDGEELGDVYVFYIGGETEASLLTATSRVATLDDVPNGVFAITGDGTERRIDQGPGKVVTVSDL
ncbi:hypothetical protein [Micromonospora radicis]|uniref:hypothetical protein n=1 Tax=Micromonospora radicis TaxID=1894971 RepID=UPI0018F2A398|nr:hypothetical protein [Micromonospora radicis]